MKQWLDGLGYQDYSIEVASADASFRSYWRLLQGDESWIVMDAPPEKEPCDTFVKIARMLTDKGLSGPRILHENHDEGFLLLTDFGNVSYLQALNEDNADSLYRDAITEINRMQSRIDPDDLPPYDEALLRYEMGLFDEWFLGKLLGIQLEQDQLAIWQTTTDTLVQNALEQPRVFVHRDYHSRNLMKIEQGNPGIIDFQDAVKGPVTYDLVSLLRDCYIDWPQAKIEQWVDEFLQGSELEQLQGIDPGQFWHWFNLTGVQRHLKAVGIFCRLNLRDGKQQFMPDIPRTLNYIIDISANEPSLAGLHGLIDELDLAERIDPIMK
ncbi:MAG: phosphotransferase [Gammaproteobacteria bacterium]|nr:phosphotransferase [Gammaproteobacteria bacterium]